MANPSPIKQENGPFKSPHALVLDEHPSAPWVAVMSDTHIGDDQSRMETQCMQKGVVKYLRAEKSIGTLVLLGDILDLDFGTLKGTIDGQSRKQENAPPRWAPGLRPFLEAVCLETAVNRIVYVVGNHDYVVWDWEVRERVALTPLRETGAFDTTPVWQGVPSRPFLGGLIPDRDELPHEVSFDVTFPHCVAVIAGHNVVLTHGHWFDKVQTGGMLLSALKPPEDEHDDPIAPLATASAQYQTVARAIAIRRETRVGVHALYKWAAGIWDWMHACFESVYGLRHTKSLSASTIREINAYLNKVVKEGTDFSNVSGLVFGHTHTSGAWTIDRGGGKLPVYNTGSFVPRPNEKSTMLVLRPDDGKVAVERLSFDDSGKPAPWPFDGNK